MDCKALQTIDLDFSRECTLIRSTTLYHEWGIHWRDHPRLPSSMRVRMKRCIWFDRAVTSGIF